MDLQRSDTMAVSMPTYGKIIIFVVFLIGGYSLVPVMVNLFVDMQTGIGNGEEGMIKYIRENTMTVVWGFWIIFSAGLIIALPAMIKDGFFAPETSGAQTDDVANPIVAKPVPAPEKVSTPSSAVGNKGALPPLELQIKYSKVILLATTQTGPQGPMYRIEEIWKQDQSGDDAGFNTNSVMLFNTKMWEMMGYAPKDKQQVVALFFEEDLAGISPREILPVENGSVSYGGADPSIMQTLTLSEFKAKIDVTK